MKYTATAIIGLIVITQNVMAFPSWIGVYDDYERCDGNNPATFSVLMNQDYWGLDAEIGIQVDGNEWIKLSMEYIGNVDGNSLYEVTPDIVFPEGAVVHYYFHGWDQVGNHIWDSNWGVNYTFLPSAPPPAVELVNFWFGTGLGCYQQCGYLSVSAKVQNIEFEKKVNLHYSVNGGSWKVLQLRYQQSLDNGETEIWGYNNNFGRWNDSIEFAISYEVDGEVYWENNYGSDYQIQR